jgi:sugar phosphate isomerase/epimerase
MIEISPVDRRTFLSQLLAGGGALLLPRTLLAAADAARPRRPMCAFVKFLQSLSYEQLAATIAELGFDGIEATVRRGGQIEPEHAEDELPKLVEALKLHGLEITVMATDVHRADDPLTQKILQTAAALGVRRYRMKYHRYDLSRPILPQLADLRPAMKDLAALNKEVGIAAVYQNHAGAQNVGASVWDLLWLLREEQIAPHEIGVAFDIRHATVEGGTTWHVSWNLVQPHLGCIYVKDFRWNGRRAENVPLGKGNVDPQFFTLLKESPFGGPISVHVEYLHHGSVAENTAALQNDLHTLRTLLGRSHTGPGCD